MRDALDNTNPLPSSTSSASLPAVVADLIGIGALFTLGPILWALFETRTIRSGMWLLGIYVVFSFGVNALKRLTRQDGPARPVLRRFDLTEQRPLLFVLGVITVLAFVWAEIDLNQATESMILLMSNSDSYGHEGEITLYYSFGPIFLWLMIGVLYLASFALPTEKRIEPNSTRFAIVEFFGLLSINVMLIATAAYIGTLLVRFETGWWGPLLAVVAIFLFFDPPRLHHAVRHPRWEPIATFSLLAGCAILWMLGIFG